MTREISIEGMTCNHCVMSVRRELARIDGLDVLDVRIGMAVLEYEPGAVSDEQILKAVTDAGYSIASPPATISIPPGRAR